MTHSKVTEYTVRLTSSGNLIHGLTIDSGYNGDREKNQNLVAEGGVLFYTPAGKKFFLKYSEFSFVFNSPERKRITPQLTVETVAQ